MCRRWFRTMLPHWVHCVFGLIVIFASTSISCWFLRCNKSRLCRGNSCWQILHLNLLWRRWTEKKCSFKECLCSDFKHFGHWILMPFVVFNSALISSNSICWSSSSSSGFLLFDDLLLEVREIFEDSCSGSFETNAAQSINISSGTSSSWSSVLIFTVSNSFLKSPKSFCKRDSYSFFCFSKRLCLEK